MFSFAKHLSRLMPALFAVALMLAGSESARAQNAPGTRATTLLNGTGGNLRYDIAVRNDANGAQSDYSTGRPLPFGTSRTEFCGAGQHLVIRFYVSVDVGYQEFMLDSGSYTFWVDTAGHLQLRGN